MASEEELTASSSPVLDFLERKLAFEKALNPSTLSLNSRSRGVKNIPAPKHVIHSNNVSKGKIIHDNNASPVFVRTGKFPPAYRNNNSPNHRRAQSITNFHFRTRSHSANSSSFSENSSPETPRSTPPSNLFRKPKDSSPETPRHSLSSNSDFASKSESSSASDTPRNTPTSNIFKQYENIASEAVPTTNIFKSKEKAEAREILSDADSEKDLDVSELSQTKNQRSCQPDTMRSTSSKFGLSGHSNDKSKRSYSDDRLSDRIAKAHENIPVFCVQDFNRGRVKDHRASPGRSRSVGSDLKARHELKEDLDKEIEKIPGRRRNKSSDELIDDRQNELISSGFKDKQKMIEAVIKKGNTADVAGLDSKQIPKASKKSSNVFRKMSFTSKLDKDLHNKIAKGDINLKSVKTLKISNRLFINGESNATTNGKRKLSKIIPKLNPLGSTLRLSPPISSDKNMPSEWPSGDNSWDVGGAGVNNCDASDSGVVKRNAKNRDVIKELHETNFLETKPVAQPPKRKSLPEEDLVKLKAASDSHKRQHSTSLTDKELIKLKPKPALNPKPNLNGIVATSIKFTPVPSPQQEIPDVTPASNDSSQLKSEIVESDTSGPPVRPPRRRNSGSPRKKNKAPLPPTPVAGSPVISESAPVYCSPPGKDSPCLPEASFTNTAAADVPNAEVPPRIVQESSMANVASVASFPLPNDLPQGPPPRKPPRTFAHEIYASNKIRQLSNGNIDSPLTHPPSNIIESDDATKQPHAALNAHTPVYAVPQKKKQSIPGDINVTSGCKPAIAPKPAHIKSLVNSNNISNNSSKRLSLIETSTVSLTQSDSDAVAADKKLKKAAHTRFSFRRLERSPPDQPPPEPPSGPKPSRLSPLSHSSQDRRLGGPPGAVECGPTSLQCWSSGDFAFMTEGKLNRQKSQSDETLASYSGYQRLQGPAVEPIYATPQLGASSRSRAASGGELHYMCSDLLATGRESDTEVDNGNRKPASRTNLIAAWKQEFRQSCRLVQHRLKKTVNR